MGKEEKWQKALGKWTRWARSQQRARVEIETRYAAKLHLLEHAEVIVQTKSESSTVARIIVNEEQWIKWEIEEAAETIASDFVTREMALPEESDIQVFFIDHWISTAFPYLQREPRKGWRDDERPKGRCVNLASKIDKSNKDRIINSVSWYADEVDQYEIARFLDRIDWPFDRIDLHRHAGGRPREENRIVAEAIVCHVFRTKRGLTEGGIERVFGWKTRLNYYRKPECRLVRQRLRLAKDILQNGGNV